MPDLFPFLDGQQLTQENIVAQLGDLATWMRLDPKHAVQFLPGQTEETWMFVVHVRLSPDPNAAQTCLEVFTHGVVEWPVEKGWIEYMLQVGVVSQTAYTAIMTAVEPATPLAAQPAAIAGPEPVAEQTLVEVALAPDQRFVTLFERCMMPSDPVTASKLFERIRDEYNVSGATITFQVNRTSGRNNIVAVVSDTLGTQEVILAYLEPQVIPENFVGYEDMLRLLREVFISYGVMYYQTAQWFYELAERHLHQRLYAIKAYEPRLALVMPHAGSVECILTLSDCRQAHNPVYTVTTGWQGDLFVVSLCCDGQSTPIITADLTYETLIKYHGVREALSFAANSGIITPEEYEKANAAWRGRVENASDPIYQQIYFLSRVGTLINTTGLPTDEPPMTQELLNNPLFLTSWRHCIGIFMNGGMYKFAVELAPVCWATVEAEYRLVVAYEGISGSPEKTSAFSSAFADPCWSGDKPIPHLVFTENGAFLVVNFDTNQFETPPQFEWYMRCLQHGIYNMLENLYRGFFN